MTKETYLQEVRTPKEKCMGLAPLHELLINAGWPHEEAHTHVIHELKHALAIRNLPGRFGIITDSEGQIISTSFKPSRPINPDEQFAIAAANPNDMSDEDLNLMVNAYKKGQEK
jgi:hypothetical protein